MDSPTPLQPAVVTPGVRWARFKCLTHVAVASDFAQVWLAPREPRRRARPELPKSCVVHYRSLERGSFGGELFTQIQHRLEHVHLFRCSQIGPYTYVGERGGRLVCASVVRKQSAHGLDTGAKHLFRVEHHLPHFGKPIWRAPEN